MNKKTELVPDEDKEKDKYASHPINNAIRNFFDSTADFRRATEITLPHVAKKHLSDIKSQEKKLKKYSGNLDGDGNYIISEAHDVKDILEIMNEYENLTKSRILPLISRSFFIGLFSCFDSFMSELLQGIYSKKPELFNNIKQEINVNDLVNYSNIEDIKKDILDKEIETFRRNSYVQQFNELEEKFSIKTLKDFPEWPEFVELTQRRNLITHNDGKVNQQYISIVTKENYNLPENLKNGDELLIEPKYLLKAIFILNKIAFMLAHTLWRKVLPSEVEIAHECMNNSIYYLLIQKRWKMASEIGCFALNDMMTKNIDSMKKMIRVINTAIAIKAYKSSSEAQKILDTMDWSAAISEFKLANCVLKDSYTEAAEIMIEIGKKGEIINEVSYYRWPLFEAFRGSIEFQNAFQVIYEKPFKNKLDLGIIQNH